MKLKGISWFEQHLEKVFACLFFAALLVVLALQFVGNESTVAVGKDQVPLSSAWEKVGQQARTVQQKLASTATPEGDPSIATSPIVKFSERYKGPVSPSPTLAVAIGETSSIGESTVTPVAGIAPLSPLQVPAPLSPIAASQLILVHPVEAQKPEVAAVLPPAMPYDKAGVTVEAEFPGAALYEALSTDPDGPGGPVRPMPRHWVDSMQILVVELFREELQADGTWAKGTSIAPMPGVWSLAPELEKPIPGAAYLKDLARLATENAETIRRPRYFQSWIGEKWMTPTDRRDQDRRLLEMAGMGDDVRRLRQQADDRFNTLRNIEDQLARLGPGGAQPPGERAPRPSPPPNSGPGGKGPGGGGGGGGGGGQRPPDGPRADPNESRRKGLEAQRDRVRRDLDAIVARLAAMNEDVSRYGVAAGETAPIEAPVEPTIAEAPLLVNPAVKVWAHDVSVERGKTYRYQMRIVLNNPMFGQGNVMVPEQQEWAKAPIVRSEPSVWTDPVKVDDESYYFIVGANPGDRQMNRIAGARAELYTFKWGRWRKGDTQLEPGDRVEASVKYPDLSVLLAAAVPGDAPIVAGQPGRRDPTQPPPPSPIPNSSPHENRQPGNLPTAPERPEPPLRPGQPLDPAAAPDPTSKPLPVLTAEVKVDTIFLNVGTVAVVPGSTRAGNIVYLRDPLGRVVTRLPDEELVSGLLVRLRRSAEQAEQDLRPAEAAQPDEPRRPVAPTPRPTEEEPAPGGKSPGGGGGA